MNGDDFMGLLEGRRSTRMFQDRPVPEDLVRRVVRAATLSPTSCNRQLWHFVAITDPEVKSRACRMSHAEQSYFHDAPVLIAVFYDTSLETRNPCSTAQVTAGIAIATLLYAAEAHGLGATYLGGIRKPDGVRQAVGAPAWMKNYGVVVVGYRDDDPPAPNRRPVETVLDFNAFTPKKARYHADIRPHLWKLDQLADFRDKLLWYKGVHIDGLTLHVDSDPRFSPKFQYMTARLGQMMAGRRRPRVLDVMSFNGDLVWQIMIAAADGEATVHAYDLTEGVLRYMRERFGRLRPPGEVNYLLNGAEDRIAIPLPGESIDVMSCYERLEHFENPLPLLKEMRRVLAPGGRVLVVVSNRHYPHLYRYRRMRQKNYSLGRNWNRGPERKYEPHAIEALFRQAGFRVDALAGLQPVELKMASVIEGLARKAGRHTIADRMADWRAQRYVARGVSARWSSSIAYELAREGDATGPGGAT